MSFDSWVDAHPYLEGIAHFEMLIGDALDSAGVISGAAIDVDTGLTKLVDTLSKLDLPDDLAAGIRDEDSPLYRLLACHVMRRVLPHSEEVDSPDAECPTCGATATLAVLGEDTGGRRRSLACACCHTTWSYKRVGCPYCGDESPQNVLQLEEEKDVRVDTCDQCYGYVKTFTGQGDTSVSSSPTGRRCIST